MSRTLRYLWPASPGYFPISQGQGKASEATKAMIKWLRFEGVSSFVAYEHSEHHASMGVARTQGLHPTPMVEDSEIRWESEQAPSTRSGLLVRGGFRCQRQLFLFSAAVGTWLAGIGLDLFGVQVDFCLVGVVFFGAVLPTTVVWVAAFARLGDRSACAADRMLMSYVHPIDELHRLNSHRTLVERQTRFTTLVHLPGDLTATTVAMGSWPL